MATIGPIPQLTIDAIGNPRTPASVLIALAEALANDYRHNIWFYESKSTKTEDELVRLLAECEDAVTACQLAWTVYQAEYSPDAEVALLRQIARLNELQLRQMSAP